MSPKDQAAYDAFRRGSPSTIMGSAFADYGLTQSSNLDSLFAQPHSTQARSYSTFGTEASSLGLDLSQIPGQLQQFSQSPTQSPQLQQHFASLPQQQRQQQGPLQAQLQQQAQLQHHAHVQRQQQALLQMQQQQQPDMLLQQLQRGDSSQVPQQVSEWLHSCTAWHTTWLHDYMIVLPSSHAQPSTLINRSG